MAVLSDPAALDTVARQITAHADDLRGRACRLAATAETVRWHSPAAGVFRADVRALALSFRRAANDIDDAAHVLRRHAATVRVVEAPLRAAEHAMSTAEHAVTGALRAVGL